MAYVVSYFELLQLIILYIDYLIIYWYQWRPCSYESYNVARDIYHWEWPQFHFNYCCYYRNKNANYTMWRIFVCWCLSNKCVVYNEMIALLMDLVIFSLCLHPNMCICVYSSINDSWKKFCVIVSFMFSGQ